MWAGTELWRSWRPPWKKGPYSSALEPDAIEQIQIEAREKVKQGFAKVYTWEWLEKNLHKHPHLKLSPLAMIPHKPRKYRAILDLSYQLLVAGYFSLSMMPQRTAPQKRQYHRLGQYFPA